MFFLSIQEEFTNIEHVPGKKKSTNSQKTNPQLSRDQYHRLYYVSTV